ncbi:MAG: TdeIII family type II restriction endonuclease [Bacteroidota bacterium]|nr:TdeIII family type II restriction endonuclease [Bacteroidota bacterium]
MLSADKKEKIAHAVIKTLYSKFSDFPEDASENRNAPFHEAFLNAFQHKFAGKVSDISFFISLSSWFHGLNTTLGQSFFEKVSHILCDGMKRELISLSQQTTITDIITDLKNRTQTSNLTKENNLIFQNNMPADRDIANFTADCYFEDDTIVAIELKTVKPNSGIFKNEKDKILSAKAGLKNANPTKEVYFYLGFPFDPLSEEPTGSDKMRFMNYSVDFTKFFDPSEVLLADELWNFLSGDSNTMKQLIDIINAVATPKFIEKYNFLNTPSNKSTDLNRYLQQLHEWNLKLDVSIVTNEATIQSKLENNKRLSRIYSQPIFKEGEYNIERLNALNNLLN